MAVSVVLNTDLLLFSTATILLITILIIHSNKLYGKW